MPSMNVLVLFLILTCTLAKSMEKRAALTQIQLNSDSEFCTYLPPHLGDNVADTESNGIPFCTKSSLSNNGHELPHGLIQSAHFVKTSSYVQVTGRIDRSKYGLHSSDNGGQYDYKNIHNVTCNGYKYWVNMLEPNDNHYCIRCCQHKHDCNIGISTLGCEHIVPGDYS